MTSLLEKQSSDYEKEKLCQLPELIDFRLAMKYEK
jgi:hypothetical protein